MNYPLTDDLRGDYRRMFDQCEVLPERQQDVDRDAAAITQNQERYQAVGDPLGIPWFFIGVIHCMESSLSFSKHLHNGDPLTARTVRVPKGRPLTPDPPYTWEQSAADSLKGQGLDQVTEWTLPGLLYQIEKYNGFGYRRVQPPIPTPYLWSFSNNYTSGKFVQDGKYDPAAKSQQCGAAVILRRLSELGNIQFDAQGDPIHTSPDTTPDSGTPTGQISAMGPLVTYSETERSDAAATLQRALNNFPGIFVRVDGVPGQRTSDAFQKVTGHFLRGDPRA